MLRLTKLKAILKMKKENIKKQQNLQLQSSEEVEIQAAKSG
jgi:hypothetical protein